MNSHGFFLHSMDFFSYFSSPSQKCGHCQPIISAPALSLWVFILFESGSYMLSCGILSFLCDLTDVNHSRDCSQVGSTDLRSNGFQLHHLFSCFVVCRYSWPLMESLHNKHMRTLSPIKKAYSLNPSSTVCVCTDTLFVHAHLMRPNCSTFCNASLCHWPTFSFFRLKVQTWIFHLNNRVPH